MMFLCDSWLNSLLIHTLGSFAHWRALLIVFELQILFIHSSGIGCTVRFYKQLISDRRSCGILFYSHNFRSMRTFWYDCSFHVFFFHLEMRTHTSGHITCPEIMINVSNHISIYADINFQNVKQSLLLLWFFFLCLYFSSRTTRRASPYGIPSAVFHRSTEQMFWRTEFMW